MRRSLVILLAACGAPTVAAAQGADPGARLVARLDLELYKATIKGLTQFGVRALDAQATTPGAREEVYCTKVGSGHPGEMYIVDAHMDGHGCGEAANDDDSGTALVMQLARVFSAPDVRTDRSIRFVLWNNEETGLNGARAYVEQRQALQGKEAPPGSGRYPEPKWRGMIQHDMRLCDHGIPRADGTLAAEQRA